MVESVTFDDLDRQVLHALLLDARAPFARIGAVLGVSDRTVARRYAKLRSAAGLRLAPLTDPRYVGQARWLLRVRCTADSAERIATVLARRPATSWVNLLAGGTEVAFATRSPAMGNDQTLEGALTRSAQVTEITAQRFLTTYFGGPRNVVSKRSILTPEQVDAFRRHVDVDPAGAAEVDEVDRRVLDGLAGDGRRPVDELAAAIGLPASTVRRRLAALRADGALYFDVTVDPRVLATPMRTAVWITVEPGDLAATGAALATHREVAFAAATTGRTNIYASVLTHDEDELYTYLSATLGSIGRVRAVETAPVVRTFKAEGVPDAAMQLLARRAR
ncbi:AsnC family transcriptional regulator [Actinotalea sp. M2MS4P-6]|uniref:Lrp/AsnC family transcriptional regulator n=1 Tax=Actinotalea sp. M2MS4P-6 TaxID=2983762 RepID=UPI0021E4C831|nr:AsnC family transcriptional regulator [Actinotalea sp. M2MS4P-6]MCV2394335.1 AsnC family transcriptional regulator [Actinotalea sp. M2MS4P-6]